MVLRSSCHSLRKGLGRRRRVGDPGPQGEPLPADLMETIVFPCSHDLRSHVQRLLEAAQVGEFESHDLESFHVDLTDREASLRHQTSLSEVMRDDEFLRAFRSLVDELIRSLPGTEFWFQCPPTLRVQPGGHVYVKEHTDMDYGHQMGEINYWLPLTDERRTRTTLHVEGVPLAVPLGSIARFHGTSKRHSVPPSQCTRVSMDFRIGIGGSFDPAWSLKGTLREHDRVHVRKLKSVRLAADVEDAARQVFACFAKCPTQRAEGLCPHGWHDQGELPGKFNKHRRGYVFQADQEIVVASVYETFRTRVHALARQLLADLAHDLGMDEWPFDLIAHSQFHVKELVGDVDVAVPPHKDPSILSLVIANGPGLEVFENGLYEPCRHYGPEWCAVIPGSLLELYGVRALKHRVVKHHENRIAATFFFQPPPEARIGATTYADWKRKRYTSYYKSKP